MTITITITRETILALLGLALLGMLGIAVGIVGSLPVDDPYDKLVHATFFAAATTGLFFLFGRRAAAAALAALAAGVVGEILQGFVGTHTVSMADVLANAAGILLVVGFMLPTTGVRRRRRQLLKVLGAGRAGVVWRLPLSFFRSG